MKTKLTIILALLALALAGCEEHKINKGVVVDKSMTPAYTSFIYSGKVMIPIIHRPYYRVGVRDNGIIETFSVNEETYSALCVGDSVWVNETIKINL